MKISILAAAFLVAALAQPGYLAARQTPASQFSREMLTKTPILNNEFYLISPVGRTLSADGSYYFKADPVLMLRSGSTKKEPAKYLRNAILVTYGAGFLGAVVAAKTTAQCDKNDVIGTPCSASEENDRIGSMAGGTVGSIWSFYKQTNESGTRTFVPILLGSIVGGIGGYYLSKEINGLIAMLLPPVSAFASLKLIKYEF